MTIDSMKQPVNDADTPLTDRQDAGTSEPEKVRDQLETGTAQSENPPASSPPPSSPLSGHTATYKPHPVYGQTRGHRGQFVKKDPAAVSGQGLDGALPSGTAHAGAPLHDTHMPPGLRSRRGKARVKTLERARDRGAWIQSELEANRLDRQDADTMVRTLRLIVDAVEKIRGDEIERRLRELEKAAKRG